MEVTLFVTRSLSDLKAYLDPADVVRLKNNALFSFDYAETPTSRTPRLYVLKSGHATSISTALETTGAITGTDADIAALRTFFVKETTFAAERAKEGDTSFEQALTCFSSAIYTGLLILCAGIMPLNPTLLGPSSLVGAFTFLAPLVNIAPIDFSKALPDPIQAHVSGYVIGTPGKDAPVVTDAALANFTLETVRLAAAYVDDDVTLALLTCRVALRHLFSLPVYTGTPFVLVGAYTAMASTSASAAGIEAYRFRVVNTVRLAFANRCLRSVTIERATSTFTLESGIAHLRLSCAGSLAFAALNESFDPLSFGLDTSSQQNKNETTVARCRSTSSAQANGLAFTGLDLVLTLPPETPALDANYRSLVLDEHASIPRASSFATHVPHQDLWFLSDQDGGTPEELGFRSMATPAIGAVPVSKGAHWYGLVFAVELVAGSNAEFLFAFQPDGVPYCGVRLAGAVGAMKAMLPATSLFGLRFRELSVGTFSQNGDLTYRIILRGLKATVLGMQLPEGACDIVLVARGGVLGWYAVYDVSGKEKHT